MPVEVRGCVDHPQHFRTLGPKHCPCIGLPKHLNRYRPRVACRRSWRTAALPLIIQRGRIDYPDMP